MRQVLTVFARFKKKKNRDKYWFFFLGSIERVPNDRDDISVLRPHESPMREVETYQCAILCLEHRFRKTRTVGPTENTPNPFSKNFFPIKKKTLTKKIKKKTQRILSKRISNLTESVIIFFSPVPISQPRVLYSLRSTRNDNCIFAPCTSVHHSSVHHSLFR